MIIILARFLLGRSRIYINIKIKKIQFEGNTNAKPR